MIYWSRRCHHIAIFQIQSKARRFSFVIRIEDAEMKAEEFLAIQTEFKVTMSCLSAALMKDIPYKGHL